MIMNSDNKKRILLVDDEYDIALAFKISLQDNGFVVDAFNDPEEALSNFKAGLYILLFSYCPSSTGTARRPSSACSLHALAPFSTAIQLEASWLPKVANPLRSCFCLFICFVIVLLLSDANAGDANVPITRAAAAKTATNASVVWFIILLVCYYIT